MTEIIPAIDIIEGRCVRLTEGDYNRCSIYDVDPADMVRRCVDHGFTRIHVVDLDGAKASNPHNLKSLEKMTAVGCARIEWGGGIKSEGALNDIFNAGASYAVVGSLAARYPETMSWWIAKYGGDKIVLGADVRGGKIAVNGWLESTELTIEALIGRLPGLSQAICTEISRDGTLSGPDIDLYKRLISACPDVIFTASGGIGNMAHIEELAAIGMPRIIVGKALYEGRISLKELMSVHSRVGEEERTASVMQSRGEDLPNPLNNTNY